MKIVCEVCRVEGYLQHISQNYYRVRHYVGSVDGKPKFEYHKQNLAYVQRFLDAPERREIDLIGQNNIDLKLKDSDSSKGKSLWAGSSARTEHQPPKYDINIDWSIYKDFLHKKYGHQYAVAQFSYALKYLDCLDNPSRIVPLAPSSKANVMKALICLTKYLGTYLEFKEKLKQHGVKWDRPDSFESFIKIMNNNHSDLIQWYKDTCNIVDDNERLFLKFMLLSGLRKSEGIMSFNLIAELFKNNKLGDYFNEEFSMLEHYKYKQFLRNTKNAYITILPKELVIQISNSKPVTYSAIRCYLDRRKIKMRLKELRSYYASFMVRHNIISEEVDLLQGRVPKSVFVRHYLKENPIELRDRVITALTQLEQTLSL